MGDPDRFVSRSLAIRFLYPCPCHHELEEEESLDQVASLEDIRMASSLALQEQGTWEPSAAQGRAVEEQEEQQ